MSSVFKTIGNYFSLVKFSHTVFALPFAMIGFALAVSQEEHEGSLRLLIMIILCMVFARNAAMGFNRLADQKFDSLNPRTRMREIPSGKIRPQAAILFIIVNAALFILTTGFINKLTLLLSPVALIIILGYSLTKRFTAFCHFVLGIGLSLAPVGAYISVTGAFSLLPLVYSMIVMTWVSGFDIIYALQDDDFDRKNSLYSLPSVSGKKSALMISSILHAATFMFVLVAGFTGRGGLYFWSGAAIFSVLLLYQHLLVKHDDLSRIDMAFGLTNGIAGILFAIFVITDII